MNSGTLSGGVVIALAAALWLAYLLPTWLRRRDYLNAERNAVRLQQTLRILAETAEAPEEVRVEATARDVARQQKVLKKARAKADAAARAHAISEARAVAEDSKVAKVKSAGGDGEAVVPRATTESAVARRARRDRTFTHAVRRTRLATTGAVVASLVGIGFGGYSFAVAGSWWLLAASIALLGCAVAVLRRLAVQVAAHRVAGTRVGVVRQDPVLYDHALEREDTAAPAETRPADTSWAPRPLPKPMYQSPGSRAATAMASLDAAVALRRAAARAELDSRAARIAAAQVPSLSRREAPGVERPAADAPAVEPQRAEREPSRYARMGMVDDVPSERIDLDEALRRRRIAG